MSKSKNRKRLIGKPLVQVSVFLFILIGAIWWLKVNQSTEIHIETTGHSLNRFKGFVFINGKSVFYRRPSDYSLKIRKVQWGFKREVTLEIIGSDYEPITKQVKKWNAGNVKIDFKKQGVFVNFKGGVKVEDVVFEINGEGWAFDGKDSGFLCFDSDVENEIKIKHPGYKSKTIKFTPFREHPPVEIELVKRDPFSAPQEDDKITGIVAYLPNSDKP